GLPNDDTRAGQRICDGRKAVPLRPGVGAHRDLSNCKANVTLKLTHEPMSDTADLKRTPLFETHLASKAKMVDFGGWNMPVQYSSIIEEHNAVRTGVGLFDVSHMGEI